MNKELYLFILVVISIYSFEISAGDFIYWFSYNEIEL